MSDFTGRLKEQKNNEVDALAKKASDTFVNAQFTAGPKQRVTVMLPWEMYEKLKAETITTGKSMNASIVEAVQKYLS